MPAGQGSPGNHVGPERLPSQPHIAAAALPGRPAGPPRLPPALGPVDYGRKGCGQCAFVAAAGGCGGPHGG